MVGTKEVSLNIIVEDENISSFYGKMSGYERFFILLSLMVKVRKDKSIFFNIFLYFIS